jgi:hypothetical protein
VKAILAVLALCACGSDSKSHDTPDAAPPTPDAPEPDSNMGFVEAPHSSPPIVLSQGGPVLTHPKIVPIFFHGDDTMQAQLESFLTQIVGSSYWTAMSSEYGVGPLTLAPSIVSTETPPATDDALHTWLQSHVGTNGWPANDGQTIYSVFLPDGVSFSAGFGTSCVNFGGFHEDTNGIVYALLPRCTSATLTQLDYVTFATSHELLEAATDPFPYSQPAYNFTDDDNAIWAAVPGGELGDMCEYGDGVRQRLIGTFMVQRQWSNASAAAGHDPCVPALSTPYVNASTHLPSIPIDIGGQPLTTRAVQVPMGMTKMVDVDLYSDAPAPDWTVEVYDVASKYQGQTAELTLALDHPTGHNGDKLHLSITRIHAGTSFGGLSEIELVSKVNGVVIGTWWAIVTQ